MKKAWNDVKSFVTVLFAIAFVVLTFMRITTGEQFYSLLQIIIAFYFGTQYERHVASKSENKEEKNMAQIIRTRRDIKENWETENPVLALGEQGYETDTKKLKFGNGVNPWNELPYFRGAFEEADEEKLDAIPTPSTIVVDNDIKDLFKEVSYNASNGVLSFTRKNGTIVTVDLPLELIVSSGHYDSTTKSIVLVLANNDEITIPVSDLVNEYYADNTTLELKTVNGKLTFNVKD